MKEHVGALCTVALLVGSLTNVFAQGSQPAQPLDPAAQAPATRAPTTPPTFPTSKAKEQPDRSGVKVYMGDDSQRWRCLCLENRQSDLLAGQPKESQELQRKGCPVNGYARQRQEIDSCRTD